MSNSIRIADQLLKVHDSRDATEALVHKYDAFLNLLCADQYAFQRDAVREAWRFLVSPKYPDLESLARENWEQPGAIRKRYTRFEDYLVRMPLGSCKAVSLDLATGTGKSFVMYALGAMCLAEGLVDRVLVLCPSLTIEDGLLQKFDALAGNGELASVMSGLGAIRAIPGIKRANETVQGGDICIENIHAVYGTVGSSITDSFRGNGGRTLVLNDEAHHVFSPTDKGMREWLKFLLHPDFGFRYVVSVSGTPYVDNEYFPDVVYRYGLKQAIEDRVVKKPNYKIEDTYSAHDWQKTYAIHQRNCSEYGATLKPITIVVTRDIARCVEVWDELVRFLMEKDGIGRIEAEQKAIWVASGIPSNSTDKARVQNVYRARNDKDSPEKRRNDHLKALRTVDDASSPVEWIVSVSMLSEGWDVKNVFQIVPHESRAFNSKLLISQVLGRGLRVPPGLTEQPLVTINNHEAWQQEVGNLLTEVLEVENTLSWGFEPEQHAYVFPLHNLRYQPVLSTTETPGREVREPVVKFVPQEKKSREAATFSESGRMTFEIVHSGSVAVGDAVKLMRLFLREKAPEVARSWPKERLAQFITDGLQQAGQDPTFLSRQNFQLLQQCFDQCLGGKSEQHPRLEEAAKNVSSVDLAIMRRQSFSEGRLKEHGTVYYPTCEHLRFPAQEGLLWDQYMRFRKQVEEYGNEAAPHAQEVAARLKPVDAACFKTPWNILYASHEPERRFCEMLLDNADLFHAFVKMPDQGGYSIPYTYRPARTAQVQAVSERFNPDFFLRIAHAHDILVVEIKADGDDSYRNRAKYRDARRHFGTLNERLKGLGEPWHYHFFFLSPEDYSFFFERLRNGQFGGWKSSLMQGLSTESEEN